MTESTSKIAVIGAGIAGLAAARALSAAGVSTVVLDKGRGPGGRTSTRRREGFTFDHGAQFLTARDERFRREVDSWLASGCVARWEPRVAISDGGRLTPDPREHELFVGAPRMSSLAEHLAGDLEVRCGVEVAGLRREGRLWRLVDAGGTPLCAAEHVIVTAPAPQAARLLADHSDLGREAARAAMSPCWAVMLGFEEEAPLDYDAVFPETGTLDWMARDSSKPGRAGVETWVLHGSPGWSSRHLEADPQQVIADLIACFGRQTGVTLPEPAHAEAHRWRHARPAPDLGTDHLIDREAGISAAGDWCAGPRISNAWLSGTRLAERLLSGSRLEQDTRP